MRVYSYLRFSDPKQAASTSAERQRSYAETWATERGLLLDDSLSLRDEGLSAYHQAHVNKGALGAFLQAVDAGQIAPGSVLIVEGLDRLSRASPILAQAQLAQIINAGLTVVTAADGKEYNSESLEAQPMDLVYSLLVMIRAHEESATKSKRVKASITRRCEQWLAGTYRGRIAAGRDPEWTRWDDEQQRMVLVPERAEAVRYIVQRYREGIGFVRIAREMQERGLKHGRKRSDSRAFAKLVRLRALLGEKTLKVQGEEHVLPGYYPALVTPQEFDEMTGVNTARARAVGKGDVPGFLTGASISACAYCGSPMAGVTYHHKWREDGTIAPGHRRLICGRHNMRLGCPKGGSATLAVYESALLDWCSDQMNLEDMTRSKGQAQLLRADIAAHRSEQAALQQQIDKLMTLILQADEPSVAVMNKQRELEKHVAQLSQTIEAMQRALHREAQQAQPQQAEQWRSLHKAAVDALDFDARMQLRKMVTDTFQQIQFALSWGEKGTGRMIVTGKSGVTRVIDVKKGKRAAPRKPVAC